MEINFERGGVLPARKAKQQSDFGVKNVEKEKSKQKSTNKKDRIKKAKSTSDHATTEEVRSAKPLTLNSMAPEMILMGIVKSAHPTHLFINLPGRLVGKVPITHISRSYNALIQNIIESQDLTTKSKTLQEIFAPGQVIYVKVLEKCHGIKQEILLSLLPEDINSEISSGVLAEGNVLLCAVQAEEDHGYIMETGIKNVQAFLPKKNIKTAPSVGELVFCKLQKITPTALTLTAFKKNEGVKIETADVPNMKTLVPGAIVDFNIARILKNGLEGLLFDGSVTAYANEMYLPTKISMTDSQIIGKEVKARILYIMPLSNQLFVSLIVDEPSKSKDRINYGTLIDDAKVVKQNSGGILFKLNANSRGFLPRRAIVKNLKSNFDIDSALIKYSPNSMHAIRVMDFNAFENCYLCTNDGKLLHEKYFGTFDLSIGMLVQAKIEEKLGDGFRLSIGHVRGFLKSPFLHKGPKVIVGDDIRVRVTEIDHDNKFVQVTNLQGFLKDTTKILASKNQIKFNESYAGVVMKDNPKNYVILFFNHVKGALLKTPETDMEIAMMGGLKVGSVKNFEVKHVKGDRITLGLHRKSDANNVGKVFDAKITAILPSGIQVFINELKIYGKVPINFLSENPQLATLIHANLKEKDVMQVVSLTNNQFSRRDVSYYRNGAILDFNDVQPGDVLRCYVKSRDGDNIELECPLKNYKETIRLTANSFDAPDDVALNVDDIVYVSVIAKNESRENTLYVTPSLHKVLKNDMEVPLAIVQSYLNDVQFIMSKFRADEKPIAKLSIGQRIPGTIKNIIGNNLLLELEDGIFAQGTVDNIQSFKVGGAVKDAVVVWLDPTNQMAYVTLKDKCKEEISIDQSIDPKLVSEKKHKSIVVYFNEFVTVCTMRKTGQPLIYAPSKFHYNDFTPVTNRALGNATSKLIIKKSIDGHLLGVFAQDFKIFQKMEKVKSKVISTVGKRKADDSEKTNVDDKKSKVILDESDDELGHENNEQENHIERNTETESEDDTPKAGKMVLQRINDSIGSKSKKLGKSLKNTLKRSAIKMPIKKKKKFINKDSMLDENLVNLVSFKNLKDAENPTTVSKKPVKILKKSTIGKISKPKRLGNKIKK